MLRSVNPRSVEMSPERVRRLRNPSPVAIPVSPFAAHLPRRYRDRSLGHGGRTAAGTDATPHATLLEYCRSRYLATSLAPAPLGPAARPRLNLSTTAGREESASAHRRVRNRRTRPGPRNAVRTGAFVRLSVNRQARRFELAASPDASEAPPAETGLHRSFDPDLAAVWGDRGRVGSCAAGPPPSAWRIGRRGTSAVST